MYKSILAEAYVDAGDQKINIYLYNQNGRLIGPTIADFSGVNNIDLTEDPGWPAGMKFIVSGSTSNDGVFTVASNVGPAYVVVEAVNIEVALQDTIASKITWVIGAFCFTRIVNEKIFIASSTGGIVGGDYGILSIFDLNTGARISSTCIGIGDTANFTMYVTPDEYVVVYFDNKINILNTDCEKLYEYNVGLGVICGGFGNAYLFSDFSNITLKSLDNINIKNSATGLLPIFFKMRDPFKLLFTDFVSQTIGVMNIDLEKEIEISFPGPDFCYCIKEGPDGKIYALHTPAAPAPHIPIIDVYTKDLIYDSSILVHDVPGVLMPMSFDFDDTGGIIVSAYDCALRYKMREGLYEWTDGTLNATAESIALPRMPGGIFYSLFCDMSSHSYLLSYIKGEKVLVKNNILMDISKGNTIRQEGDDFTGASVMSMVTKSRENIYAVQANTFRVFHDSGGYLRSFDIFEPDEFSVPIILNLIGCSVKYIIAYVMHIDTTKWIYWINMLDDSVAYRLEVDLLDSVVTPMFTIDIYGNVYILAASQINNTLLRVIKYSVNKLEWEREFVSGNDSFGDGKIAKPAGIFVDLNDRIVAVSIGLSVFFGVPQEGTFNFYINIFKMDGTNIYNNNAAICKVVATGAFQMLNSFTAASAGLSLYGDCYLCLVFYGGHNDIVDPGSSIVIYNGDGIATSHFPVGVVNLISDIKISVDLDNRPIGMFVGNEFSEFIKFFQGESNLVTTGDYSVVMVNIDNLGIFIDKWKVVDRPFIKGVGNE